MCRHLHVSTEEREHLTSLNFQFLSVWTHCLFYSVDYNSILSLFILMFSYPRLAGGTPLSLVLEPFSPHSLSASLLSGRTGYSHSYCAFPAPAQESVILLRSLFLFLVSVENLKTRIWMWGILLLRCHCFEDRKSKYMHVGVRGLLYTYLFVNLYVLKNHVSILMLPIPIQYHRRKKPKTSFTITVSKLRQNS